MNKIINKLWVLILLIFPVNVYAMTGGLSISCSPKTVRAGETVTCTITGTSDEFVKAVEAQVSILNDKVTIESFAKNNVWSTGNIENTNYFNVSAENSTIKDNFTVGTLTLKISEDANESNDIRVNIQNVSFTGNDDNKVSEGLTGGSDTFSIEGKSEPQTPTLKGLKSLDIVGGILSPQFDSTFTAGMIMLGIETSSFKIIGIPNNENDQVVCKNTYDNSVLDCNNIIFKGYGGQRTMNVHVEVGEGDNFVSYGFTIIKETPPTIEPAKLVLLTIGSKQVDLTTGKIVDDKNIDLGEIALDNIDNYQITFAINDEENYYVSSHTNPTYLSGERYIHITIEPKDSSKGLNPINYDIHVVKAGGQPTVQPTQKPVQPSGNPQTGGTTATVMAILLFLSLGASIYFYQRNMSSYN